MSRLRIASTILLFIFIAFSATDIFAESAPSYGVCDELASPTAHPITDTDAAYTVMDAATGCVLFEHSSDTRVAPASATLIMTALLLIENTEPDEWDVPTEPITDFGYSLEGNTMGLRLGDRPTRRVLLNGALLANGCDAAYIIALLVAGSETDFVFLMNQRCAELGMTNTGYENAYGFAGMGHFTCARDTELLVQEAIRHDIFCETVASAGCTVSILGSDGSRSIELANGNRMVIEGSGEYYRYATGGNAGSLRGSDYCLTATAKKDGVELICTVLGCDGPSERYDIAEELFEAVFCMYESEGGLYSRMSTNAYLKVSSDGCRLCALPMQEDGLQSVPVGTGLLACAYHTDAEGGVWYLVAIEGGYAWIDDEYVELVRVADDVEIVLGSALTDSSAGHAADLDINISTRHTLQSVTMTVFDEFGNPVLGATNYPCASGVHDVSGTTIARDADISSLSPGRYSCFVQAVATADIPMGDRTVFTSAVKSVFCIGDDVCISYDALCGNQPIDGAFGETFVTGVVPERFGFEFAGWNTCRDGSGESFAAGDIISPDSSVTLYAMWTPAESVWDSGLALAEVSTAGSADVISGSVGNPAGIAYVRLVISGDANIEAVFPVGDIIFDCAVMNAELEGLSSGSYSVGIYAYDCTASTVGAAILESDIAIIESQYRVNFEPNGGSIDVNDVVVRFGEAFGVLPVPTREGFEFVRWVDANGNTVDADTIVPAHAGAVITLFAEWNEIETDPVPTEAPADDADGGATVTIIIAAAAVIVAAVVAVPVVVRKKRS